MKKTLIIEKNCDYTLERDEDGNLYFEVECGTTAVYHISIRLNAKETEAWQKEGESALRHLSYMVRDLPEDYLKRRF